VVIAKHAQRMETAERFPPFWIHNWRVLLCQNRIAQSFTRASLICVLL